MENNGSNRLVTINDERIVEQGEIKLKDQFDTSDKSLKNRNMSSHRTLLKLSVKLFQLIYQKSKEIRWKTSSFVL